MRIGYTMGLGRGGTDLLLSDLAGQLAAGGLRTSGIVQINTDCGDGGLCDMDVKVLPDGPVFRISQSLGREAKGCRLDPDALERSVAEVAARLASGADVLIVNKFGKHEAGGGGFRDVIGSAMAADVPVLVGLNPLNKPAFDAFTGDLAMPLTPDLDVLEAWVRAS